MSDSPAATARVNHVGIAVSDLDRSIALFEACFGLRLASRGGRPEGLAARLTGVAGAEVEIAFLEGAGVLLELLMFTQPAQAGALPAPHFAGAAHLALDVADLEGTLRRAAPHGLRLLGEVLTVPAGPNKGARMAYCQHDCGAMLELIQPAPAD